MTMTRDRLKELKDLMRKGDAAEETDSSKKENLVHLDVFCNRVKQVRSEVAELQRRVEDLKILLIDNQRWMSEKARRELEREIEEEKLIIGTAAKTIRNNLKSMRSSPSGKKQMAVMVRIKEVQLNSILNELNEVLRDYLNCLVHQRERSMKILQDMVEVKGGSHYDLESLLEEGKFSIFTNNLLKNDMEEKSKLREAENRRCKILKIESSILEVRNIFNELALIVDLQQEKVEEIEKLVDENLVRVESGKKRIFSASKKREKMRYRKLIVGAVCCCIVIIVIILLASV